MVRQDILGALRLSITNGETLKQAMQRLYNAGYKKEEIEEAAKVVQIEQYQQTPQTPVQSKQQTPVQPIPKNQIPSTSQSIQKVSSYGQTKTSSPQRVQPPRGMGVLPLKTFPPRVKPTQPRDTSSYKQPPLESSGKGIIVILIMIFFLLFGSLIALFFFKQEIIVFLNDNVMSFFNNF